MSDQITVHGSDVYNFCIGDVVRVGPVPSRLRRAWYWFRRVILRSKALPPGCFRVTAISNTVLTVGRGET